MSNNNREISGSKLLVSTPWRVYILTGFLGLLILGILAYGYHTGLRMSVRYAPLIDAAMEVRLQATYAHLWCEEILSGDRHESEEQVYKYLDKSQWYAQAMLVGGRDADGRYKPLSDEKMRDSVKGVVERIKNLRLITERRLRRKHASGAGTNIDQQYDAIFLEFISQVDAVETGLQKLVQKKPSGLSIYHGIPHVGLWFDHPSAGVCFLQV